LRGLVFKSHGGADKYSYEWAIQRAFDAAKNDVLSRISASMALLMPAADVVVPELNGSTQTSETISQKTV
jgi:glycerol-3-phosphate acyltransferase PlsX